MKKWKLLPKLALIGVIKNGTVYFPYIGAGIFSVFTYFILASILCNDLMQTLPNSSYAWLLMKIGQGLLTMILLPFLCYANSFLIKRRKTEIGLYHILGLEKHHIGVMLFWETILLYVFAMLGGVAGGMLLAKLFFLLLLRMTGLPVDVQFVFSTSAFKETALVFLWIYGFNFAHHLWAVGKSRATEILAGSKKGEKEPKGLWLYAVLGLAALIWGYTLAIRSKVDPMLFIHFFLAVLLVIVGTYLLFTSGSVALLKIMKQKTQIYYKPANFITISGMLYRMKKNAASLVNICIFSTMVIITFICTSSLYFGQDDISNFNYPYDVDISLQESSMVYGDVAVIVRELEQKFDLDVLRNDIYNIVTISCGKDGNLFQDISAQRNPENGIYENSVQVGMLTLDDYNRMADETETLNKEEAMILSTGIDFAYNTMNIAGIELQVKKELWDLYAFPKAERNTFLSQYYIVVRDEAIRDECVKALAAISGFEDVEVPLDEAETKIGIKLEGENSPKRIWIEEFIKACSALPNYKGSSNNLDGRERSVSMNGGLLFIGTLFGFVFMMCLLLIMYYKQISEGYEDRDRFTIMQKVGMSDEEIKSTIHRQILFVFFLPLVGSIMHTAAGFFMVIQLVATLGLFTTTLLAACGVGSVLLFTVLYMVSYLFTAKTYYRIIKR